MKFPPPKFFATDKDIHDLLTRFSIERLVWAARERGLILSHLTNKDTVISYLSKQMYSYPQLQTLLAQLESDEREERVTPSKLAADVEIDKVITAFETVRDGRKDPDEQLNITQRPTGELEVKVKYVDTDYSRASLRQRTAKDATFVVQKNGSVLDFSYNNNARAAEIYAEVKALLKPEAGAEVTECVSLEGLTDPAARTQFFLDLMNNMETFRLREVRDVKAERMQKARGDDKDAEKEKEQVESLVKKMALSGDSVWSSPEFKAMSTNGFFVYNAKWRGTETEGDNRTIEFEAGFSTGDCRDFSIRVLGIYNRNEKGDLEKRLTVLPATEREALRARLQKSAFESLEKAQPPKPKVAPAAAPALLQSETAPE